MPHLAFDGTLAGWRRAARDALAQGCTPDETVWLNTQTAQVELALAAPPSDAPPREPDTAVSPAGVPDALRVPRTFLELAEAVACHRDDTRWARLYGVLWRLFHGEPRLLEVPTDPAVHALRAMAKAVDRDIHHMRAFVRFREITTAGGPWFVAWFAPQHRIVERNAPFFRDRFASMRWSILTPDRCAHWDTARLTFTAGVARNAAPAADEMEDLWRTYYASTFNPARLNVSALSARLPRHYWQDLPEAGLIPQLVAEARPQAGAMVARSDAQVAAAMDFSPVLIPATTDLAILRDAAAACRACPLWRNATGTVFGEGPPSARVVIVGEQPGDQEDRRGAPFVGPAGQLLDRALAAAEIDRSRLYLTNAVKHFKWEPRGKRRLHQRPDAREVAACRPWLAAELGSIRPSLIVCLGVTAAESVLGRTVRVLSERGQRCPTEFGAPALITVHPSALLRLPAGVDADAEFSRFVADLRVIREAVADCS